MIKDICINPKSLGLDTVKPIKFWGEPSAEQEKAKETVPNSDFDNIAPAFQH